LDDVYFSSNWQVVEEDVSGTMQDQYVWSPVYVNALIERDTPTQRLYVQQDANWNVTSLVNTSGSVVERYVYDPYGLVTFLNANWNTTSGSAYSWIYLYQGGRLESPAGLYVFEHRDSSPTLGRWVQNDPLGFGAGDNSLYRFTANNPINGTDPSGQSPKDSLLKYQYLAQLKRALKERDQKIANIIDKMQDLTKDEKKMLRREIQRLLDAAQFDWDKRTGFFGECFNWVFEYESRTAKLRASMEKASDKMIGKFFEVNLMYWSIKPPLWFSILTAAGGGHPYELWGAIDPGHAAIEITLKDGTKIYLDDGNLGGLSHTFFSDDVPSRYYPIEGYPKSTLDKPKR
jgi:RHS repeat-associated protein